MPDHLPEPRPNWFPSITMSDARWRRVIRALERTRTKADSQVARQIEVQILRANRDSS